jgi:hypothetical protein
LTWMTGRVHRVRAKAGVKTKLVVSDSYCLTSWSLLRKNHRQRGWKGVPYVGYIFNISVQTLTSSPGISLNSWPIPSHLASHKCVSGFLVCGRSWEGCWNLFQ